ncbi:kinesin-like protein KIF20B [Orussus abietinus]|uniref:kinesin-like protein KIF20B n=1 Tax=Orussus abietinus TaxID=222816 RepID=UPI000C715FC6|nr:kinesin-like protein KIF20B [Orussus abietinus]
MKVFLRLKPNSLNVENSQDQEEAYTIVSSTSLISKIPIPELWDECSRKSKKFSEPRITNRKFSFTKIFGTQSTQTEIFDEAIKLQISDFLRGRSSTIMTYGTSDSGKSYTLLGTPTVPGMISLSIEFIFSAVNCTLSPWYKPDSRNRAISLDEPGRLIEIQTRNKLLSSRLINRSQCNEEYQNLEDLIEKDREACNDAMNSVWISFAEIYNEIVYDLLEEDEDGKNLPLKLVTDSQGAAFVKGLRWICVTTGKEAYQILMAGQTRLSVAATSLNPRSSRSHSIFTIKLMKYSKENAPEEVEISTVTFCDLAGSGRTRMASCNDKLLAETRNINSGLLVLGRCLKAIWEFQTSKQSTEAVGTFRESKLTRLFQRALSGREQLTLMVTVNTSPKFYVDTQIVLYFSTIAGKIMLDVPQRPSTGGTSSHSQKSVGCWEDYTPPLLLSSEKAISEEQQDKEDLELENEKLKAEISRLKTLETKKEIDIREDVANVYNKIIKDLDEGWKERLQVVEEAQEGLLKWSVTTVEEFYKERIDSMGGRKRRRIESGDYNDEDKAVLQDLEEENVRITSKVVILKEEVKKLRAQREKVTIEKNEKSFTIGLMKEELDALKKSIIEFEEANPLVDESARLVDRLRELIKCKETEAATLSGDLERAKNEYVRIKSTNVELEKELNDARTVLDEYSESMDAIKSQLLERNKYIMNLQNQLVILKQQLAEIEADKQEIKEKYNNAEAENVILSKKLEECEETLRQKELTISQLSSNVVECKKPSLHDTRLVTEDVKLIAKKISSISSYHGSAVDTNDSEIDEEFSEMDSKFFSKELRSDSILRNSEFDRMSEDINFEDANDRTSFLEAIERVYRCAFRSVVDSSKDDSGIVMNSDTGSRKTSTENNIPMVELHEKSVQTSQSQTNTFIQGRVEQLQLDYTNLKTQHLRETLRVTELSEELENVKYTMQTLKETSQDGERRVEDYRHRLASKEEEIERVVEDKVDLEKKLNEAFRMQEIKRLEYERKIDELKGRLKIREQSEDRTSKCLEEYLERSATLESQLSVVHMQLERASIKCLAEHVPRIDKLEKDLSGKTLLVSQLDSKLSEVERDLIRVSELGEKVAEFENTLDKCQREKDDLRRQLHERSESQASLEWKLKRLTNIVKERDTDITTVKTDLGEIVRMNLDNSEIAKGLSKEVMDAFKKLNVIKEEQLRSEETRRKLERMSRQEASNLRARLGAFERNAALLNFVRESNENAQDELDRLKILLHEKEREMSLFKKNRDTTIRKYESLVRQLQIDLERNERQSGKIGKIFQKCIKEDSRGESSISGVCKKSDSVPIVIQKKESSSKISDSSKSSTLSKHSSLQTIVPSTDRIAIATREDHLEVEEGIAKAGYIQLHELLSRHTTFHLLRSVDTEQDAEMLLLAMW